MKLTLNQLSTHLKQKLAPIYLVSGDEILLVQEAADAILKAAKGAGYHECIRFTVDAQFDWSLFREASISDSLFSDRQCIQLRLTSAKLSEAGKNILAAYLQKPSSDKCLLLIADKLDAAVQKTAWFKLLNNAGVFLPIWPLQPAQLPDWIKQRLHQVGLSADTASIHLIAELTEGNLLSTAQMIEKLSLLYQGRVTFKQIREMSADSARYNVFDLVDKMLQGEVDAILRVLRILQEEDVEPTLILWAITRELRELIQHMNALRQGQTLSQVLSGQRIWENRKPWIARTLRAHSEKSLYDALQSAARVDLLIKGMESGSVWMELTDLTLAVSGAVSILKETR